jgi:hypothetical protein
MPKSLLNNRIYPLAIGETFTGGAEATGIETGQWTAISVSVVVPTACTLKIEQTYNKTNWYVTETTSLEPDVLKIVQQAITLPYFRVKLENLGTLQTYCHMVSSLVANLTQDLNIRSLDAARDSVTITPTGTQDVNVTNDVVVQGQNNNYEFYPTPTNNTSAVYADGTAGVDVAGGWSYSNIATGKINWYLYGSAGLATDYKVSQLNSMYAVVNNQSTLGLALAQNPWVMIYTRPDSGTNGAGWYKSKLFFGSNAHTDISGIKLLYTGSDPVDVHPEITGINRIQLLFVEALSTKSLASAQNENIMLGSLQTTNNTAQAGAFNFVMQEFGADWVKTPSILPIEFNKVVCEVTGTVTTIKPALITQTQVITSPTAGLASSSFDLGTNSLFDCLLLAAGTITAGNVRLDYSIDNLNWFPDNTSTSLAPLSTADPHFVYRGISTGSRYVRISSAAGSTFAATTLTITFSSKLN